MIGWFKGRGMYDFKARAENSPLHNSELFDTGSGLLHPDQFGNYLVGYAAGYAFAASGDAGFLAGSFGAGLGYRVGEDLNPFKYFSVADAITDEIGQLVELRDGAVQGISDYIDQEK
jgi:hypothetical protein